jgi:hypothetical protein
MVPQFGPYYKVQWEQEDMKLAHLVEDGVSNPALAINKEFFEFEESIFSGDIQLGPFSERLLGAFIREGVVPNAHDDEEIDASLKQPRLRSKVDLQIYEDRLKAELIHIGLIPKPDPENNEVLQALVKAQQELREQIQANSVRKKRLLPIAEEYMAYQEYQTLLGDINKAVDSAYTKRFVNCTHLEIESKKIKKEAVHRRKRQNARFSDDDASSSQNAHQRSWRSLFSSIQIRCSYGEYIHSRVTICVGRRIDLMYKYNFQNNIAVYIRTNR